MTLKSSCSRTAFPCLSLRGNSEECDHCGSVPAVCLSAGDRGRDEGRKGKEIRAGGLLLTFPVSSPQLPSFGSCFLAIALLSGFSSCCSTVIGSLFPSPAPRQHQHSPHIHYFPNLPVIQDLLIGLCLSCWGFNKLNKIFVRAEALCHGPNMNRRTTTSQQDGQKCWC